MEVFSARGQKYATVDRDDNDVNIDDNADDANDDDDDANDGEVSGMRPTAKKTASGNDADNWQGNFREGILPM